MLSRLLADPGPVSRELEAGCSSSSSVAAGSLSHGPTAGSSSARCPSPIVGSVTVFDGSDDSDVEVVKIETR